ncbi:MAG: ABC transporter permease [Synergistaceae bacterium]|jgi:peptide/nickel transport system permease protein|nr:ABC transporter permease [Synergistaceae bacterium]
MIFRKNSMLRLTWVRLCRNHLAIVGLVILVALIFTAVFADVLAPYAYFKQSLRERLQAPSLSHWLGTDEFGRDVLSRLIYGARVSLQVGLVAVSISLVLGGSLGAIAGYYGGKLDHVIMRVMDIQLSIPTILLAIAISAALGPGLFNLMIAVGISSVPAFARLLRASVLSVKEMEFVEAARAMGAGDLRIVALHILPNCCAPLIVQSTLRVANAILSAASLSFIGLGIQPPFPEWGGMLSSARGYLRGNAYLSLFPGIAIVITIIALNFLGDGLRDALDPKQKR